MSEGSGKPPAGGDEGPKKSSRERTTTPPIVAGSENRGRLKSVLLGAVETTVDVAIFKALD